MAFLGFFALNERYDWLDLGFSTGWFASENRQFLNKVRKTKEGMTEAEVDTLFAKWGPSARTSPEGKVELGIRPLRPPAFVKFYNNAIGRGEGFYLCRVDFDGADHVVDVGVGAVCK